MSIRTAADTLAPRLPKTIRAVQARFAISPELWALPRPALRLAQIIAAYTPLNRLDAAVGFNRRLPAAALNCSIRSIDRHLSSLVKFGLIERLKQKKHGASEWDCTRIKWTQQAIMAFFKPMIAQFPAPASERAGHVLGAIETTISTPIVCATKMAYKTEATPLGKPSKVSIEKKSARGAAQNEQEPQKLGKLGASKFSTDNKAKAVTLDDKKRHGDLSRLPTDLIDHAKTLGLKRSEMVYLMSLCKRASQRIQDVLTVVMPDLTKKGLQGRSVVAWLTPVIASGRDFKWIAKTTHSERLARCRKQKRQGTIEKMAALITEAQQMILPNDAIALESISQITMIRTKNGMVSSMPTRQLAEECLRRSLTWSKRVLRGIIEKPSKTLTISTNGSRVTPPVVPKMSSARTSEMKKMLAILKTSSNFSRMSFV